MIQTGLLKEAIPQYKNNINDYNPFLTEANYIEAEDIENKTKYYPVFIILTYTGSVFARLVKYFTNDSYTHASISFDSNMNKMLSFNQDGDGLTEENLKEFCKNGKEDVAKYSTFMYMAKKDEYNVMKNFVNNIKSKIKTMKYNLLGALRLIPNQFIFGKESEREDKYFCSEFVASILNSANTHIINKAAFLIRPQMLSRIRKFKFIKRGFIKNFNPLEIDSIIKRKLEEDDKYTNIIIE